MQSDHLTHPDCAPKYVMPEHMASAPIPCMQKAHRSKALGTDGAPTHAAKTNFQHYYITTFGPFNVRLNLQLKLHSPETLDDDKFSVWTSVSSKSS